MTTYHLEPDAFVIEDYTRARPFASFLPGIAGLWGIPMWAFYVNRGQAIAGFGIQDKDHPIMEFLPANRAYRVVSLEGFRTFLKLRTASGVSFYEPFQTLPPEARRIHTERSALAPPRQAFRSRHDGGYFTGTERVPAKDRAGIRQRLRIRMADLTLDEEHRALGLAIRVHYFTIPHEPFAALARVVTITNRSRRRLDLELIDGLPIIIPHGMLDGFLKNMSRTIEAWVSVRTLERKAAFYQLKVEPHDRPEVVRIRAGNFYAALAECGQAPRRLDPIVDPSLIFGRRDDLVIPEAFLSPGFRLPSRQCAADKTPCAMSHLRGRLEPGASWSLSALFGHAEGLEQANAIAASAMRPEFFRRKAEDNRRLIDELTQPVATTSRLRAFDQYCRQTFLDNTLRGGAPIGLGNGERRHLFYVYSRKHGDLERDYNEFILPPTHFSQGNSNYRDVNQNRRSDAWFHPEVEDRNVVTFFNLIQLDGFNPLVFKGLRCVADDPALVSQLHELAGKSFTPGEFLQHLGRRKRWSRSSAEEALNRIVARCRATEEADHGEGFWTDHWTYNLDLLESYLALYPERLRRLLLEQRIFTFYDNAHVVLPRRHKYHVTRGVVRQYHAVRRDREKTELIQSRATLPHCVRMRHGRGEVYHATLLVKMLCVVINKLASLDPSGMGVEMEADKPNWCDALNGLPGLLGSSLCETFELKRWIRFLLDALDQLNLPSGAAVALPEELAAFMEALTAALGTPAGGYWELSAQAKERYRERTRLGLSGRERTVRLGRLRRFLKKADAKVDGGLRQAFDRRHGLYASYFYHEVITRTHTRRGLTILTPTRWARHTLPWFLEGMVHALRLASNPIRARALHRALRRSALYDRTLKMYRICDSLAKESEEIGRCQVFNPGWLENQSIWLHMEYKYLLELLRSGLHKEFYEEFFRALIPFQPPKRYGRSILENSSFLVSSAYADASLHGAGFVARLSGATAEFLQMWLWMTAGQRPFSLNRRGELELRLAPVLPPQLFNQAGVFKFRFLGRIDATYRNPQRRATFGPGGVAPRRIRLSMRSGHRAEFPSGVIPDPYADMCRRGEVTSLDVELAR